jgi:hypothetical protein
LQPADLYQRLRSRATRAQRGWCRMPIQLHSADQWYYQQRIWRGSGGRDGHGENEEQQAEEREQHSVGVSLIEHDVANVLLRY